MAKKNKLAPECNSSDAFVTKTEIKRTEKKTVTAVKEKNRKPIKKTSLSATSNSGGKTKEMVERDRRNKRREKAIKKADNRERRHLSKIPLHIFFTVLIYIVIAGIIVAVTGLYILPHFGIDDQITYRYDVFLDGKKYGDNLLKTWSRANGGGGVNVNMSLLSDVCDIAMTGSNDSMRYTVKQSGEYMEFYMNSSECNINGRQIRMSGPSLYVDGALYVPLDFVQNYVSGVEVTYNESTFRVETFYKENDVITFGISHAPKTNEEIIFTSLDYELQEEIIAASTPSEPVFDFFE